MMFSLYLSISTGAIEKDTFQCPDELECGEKKHKIEDLEYVYGLDFVSLKVNALHK